MRALEIVFVAILLGFLFAQAVRGVRRNHAVALAAAGLLTLAASASLEQLRWQMALACLLFVVLALLLLKRSYWHVAVRSVGVFLGLVLVAITVTLSLGLPIFTLPAPDGPNVVGSTSLTLVDDSRDNSPIAAERIVTITQIVALRFFDAYLRGGSKPRFDADLPELTVEINAAARDGA